MAALPAQTLTATAKELGTLGGSSSFAEAVDGSIVVGAFWNAGVNHAFAYDLSAASPAMIDLGTLGGASSEAVAVAGNVVVGWSQTGSGERDHGFAYDLGAADPKMIDLGAGEATAVDGNIVVGSSSGHAFAYDLGAANPQVIDLGALGGSSSTATAVSGNIVVGWSYTTSGLRHAFAYDLGAANPKLIDLGTLGGSNSEATAVSGNIVVGFSDTQAAGVYTGIHAFAYDLAAVAPKMRDLGVPGRGWSTEAVAVDGKVVAVNSLRGADGDHGHAYAIDLATSPPTTIDLGLAHVTAVSGSMLVGNAGRPGVGSGAFAYDLGATTPTLTDLGALVGDFSAASAVDGNIVVGEVDTTTGRQAVVWSLFYTTAPALAFSRSYTTVNENVGRVTFTVTRAGDVTVPVTVDYAAKGSPYFGGLVYPATAGQDFVATRGTLRFAAGQTRKSLTVRVLNDNIPEVQEMLGVALSAPTGGAILGTPNTSAVTIRISDQRPDAWISTRATRGFIGDKVYSTTAAGQTKYLTTRRAHTGTFYVRIVNHHYRANTYRLRGTPAPPGAVVRYYHGAHDVTAQLRSQAGLRIRLGHFQRAQRNWWPLRIQIKIRAGAAIGTRKSATVTATWSGDSVRTDAVKGVVRVVR